MSSSLALFGFLDQDHRYKSVATQIPCYSKLAPVRTGGDRIPYCARYGGGRLITYIYIHIYIYIYIYIYMCVCVCVCVCVSVCVHTRTCVYARVGSRIII